MNKSEAERRRQLVFEQLEAAGPSPLSTAVQRRLPGKRDQAPAVTHRQLGILSKLAARALHDQREIQLELVRLTEESMLLEKRLRKAESGLQALLRRELAALGGGGSDDLELDVQRFSLLSQNEEDGYILALLKHCGAPNRSFVELGSGRTGGNSGLLAQTAKWRGLMVDASQAAATVAMARFGATGRVHVRHTFVTPENVDGLIEEVGLAGEIDLLSLDIDSFDYWVLQAISVCKPRLMVVEYNDRFGAEARVTVPLGTDRLDRRRHYFGASLSAMTALADQKGYRLITCDKSGTNAFFVRSDLATALPTAEPDEVFREHESRMRAPLGTSFIESLRADGLDLVEV